MSEILTANSNLFKDPVGAVWLFFKGYNLGCTTGGTTVGQDMDTVDIMCDQKGSKRQDAVISGKLLQVNATFSAPNEDLLALLLTGVERVIGSGEAETAFIPSLFESLRTELGGVLQLKRSINDSPSTNPDDIFTWYDAVPVPSGDLMDFKVDAQKTLGIAFDLYSVQLADVPGSIISSCTIGSKTFTAAFGYLGTAANVGTGMPAAVIPDRNGPQFVSAEMTSATALEIVFNESLNSVLNATGILIENQTDEAYAVSTAAVINGVDDKILDVTLPAATAASGDVLKVSYQAAIVDDADSNANPAENNKVVTNSVP